MTDSILTADAQDSTAAPASDVQSDAVAQAPSPEQGAEQQATESADQAPAGAPEQYEDFNVGEGYEIDTEVLDSFKGIAKELGITQDAAQKFIDLQTTLISKQAEAAEQARLAQSQQWADAVKADKELGGEHFDANRELAVSVISKYANPELRQLLNDTGLGNHPEMVRFCQRIGKGMTEDSLVLAGTQSQTSEMTIVDAFR